MALSVAVVDTHVGKTPEQIPHSFIFDEMYRLARRGVRVHAVRLVSEKPSKSYGIYFYGVERRVDPLAMSMLLRSLRHYPLISVFRSPKRIYSENLFAANIARVVEEWEIDLIHAHFAHYGGFAGLLAKKKTGKPLVVTVHGFDILKDPAINYGIRLSRRYDAIVRKVLREADAVITASRATYSEAVRVVEDRENVYLIPNGVDLKRFNPNIEGACIRRKLGIGSEFVIFTVRNHKPVHGIAYLVMAASIVARRRKDVVFIIGGDGVLRSFHEQMAVKLGVSDRVIFTGRIPQEELPYYYAASDVVVVPSLQEAFGLVVSEGMAAGKPVVASRVGGILDQVVDGYNGFLVEPGKPEEIAERIIYLADNPDEARRMGLRGRRIAEEKFDIEKRVDRIISLYRSILSGG